MDSMVHGTAARVDRLCAAMIRALPELDVVFLQEVDAECGMLDWLELAFSSMGWQLFVPRDPSGRVQHNTTTNAWDGATWGRRDNLCALAARRGTATVHWPFRMNYSSLSALSYPIVEVSGIVMASVHVHYQASEADCKELVVDLRRLGVALVGGDFNRDLAASTMPVVLSDGDMSTPTFPTDTNGPAGNTRHTRIDYIIALNPSLSAVQIVSPRFSNVRRADYSFEHSDHLAVEATVRRNESIPQ